MIRNHSRHGSRFPITLGGGGGYSVNKSLRFRASASAYLNRTPTTTGSRTTFTWSGWVKRGALGTGIGNRRAIFSSGRTDGSPQNGLVFRFFDDQINASSGGGVSLSLTSTAVYRDPAAWYHLVFAVDTTQGTASNRVKIYVNGDQVTSFGTATYPSASQNFDINTSSYTAYNGVENDTATLVYYFDGEIAEVNFVDGQALTPTSFGASSTYNQWLPIAYAGTYGTNGFYLPFTNTTSTSTLVADSSGNANNWTPNNISLTAGSTYDSLTDVPTLTSTTVANYAVLNALAPVGGTFSSANLQYTGPTAWRIVPATLAMNGSYYAEATLLANAGAHNISNVYAAFGIAPISIAVINPPGIANTLTVYDTGYVYNQTVQATDIGSSFVLGNVIGIAFNSSTGDFTIYKNNVSVSTGTFSATGPFTFIYSSYDGTGGQMAMNFGQRPFTYTAPTGFLPLNTFNI